MLCHEDIKAVVVATPAENHFAVAHNALSTGKHVFVEKPLSLTDAPIIYGITIGNYAFSGFSLISGCYLEFIPAEQLKKVEWLVIITFKPTLSCYLCNYRVYLRNSVPSTHIYWQRPKMLIRNTLRSFGKVSLT